MGATLATGPVEGPAAFGVADVTIFGADCGVFELADGDKTTGESEVFGGDVVVTT